MKIRKGINRMFSPLHKTFSLLVEGGAVTQIYYPDKDEFVPDRTLTPVVIYPRCEIIDPDKKIQSGNINIDLSGIIWRANGTSVAGNPDYEIDLSRTSTRGTLLVKKNVPEGEQISLEFEAKYLDPRTGDLVKFAGSTMINTNAAAFEIVSLEIDNQSVIDFNPISDENRVTITPTARLGGNTISGENVKYFLKVVESGNERDLEELVDLELVSFNPSTGVMEFDLRYVPEKKNYRIYTDYIKSGDPSPESPTNRAAFKDFSLRRRFEPYTIDLKDFGRVQPWQSEIRVEAMIILDNSGEILQEPNRFFDIEYFFVENGHESHMGYGNKASISLPYYRLGTNNEIAISIEEKRELMPLSDNGVLLTDGGKVLTI